MPAIFETSAVLIAGVVIGGLMGCAAANRAILYGGHTAAAYFDRTWDSGGCGGGR